MTIQKGNISGTIFGIIIVLSAIVSFTPILNRSLFFIIIGALIFFYSIFHANDKLFRSNISLLICTYFYILLCIAYSFLGISSISLGVLIHHLFFFICILTMLLYPTLLSEKQCKWTFLLVVFVILFNILDNIRLCIIYPEILALVNRFRDNPLGVLINIGGAKFYDGVLFFYIISLLFFLNSQDKKYKRISFVCAIVSAVFIFGFCLKATTLVYAALSTFLLYFARRAKTIRKFAYKICGPALLLYIIAFLFSDFIVDMLFSLFSSERLAQRLAFLIDSENSPSASGTVDARSNLWMLSISTWTESIQNFFFGIGDHTVDWERQSAYSVGIGKHSDLFDSLAKYGLLGMSVLSLFFYHYFKYVCSIFKEEYKIQIIVVFLMFFIVFITKVVFFPELGFMMFVFLPMVGKLLNSQ